MDEETKNLLKGFAATAGGLGGLRAGFKIGEKIQSSRRAAERARDAEHVKWRKTNPPRKHGAVASELAKPARAGKVAGKVARRVGARPLGVVALATPDSRAAMKDAIEAREELGFVDSLGLLTERLTGIPAGSSGRALTEEEKKARLTL